ncbi:MAG: aspartyl-phosphate phosphatase Spo0E family protein [Bacillota bacterium]
MDEDVQEIKEKIEKLRKEVIKLGNEKENLHDKELVRCSKKLDKLLSEYMENENK